MKTSCEMIEEIRGTKSTKIMELINRRLQKQKEAMLQKHIKDVRLIQLRVVCCAKEYAYKKARDDLQRREEELDLEWNTYADGGAKYKIVVKCRISQQDYNLLQEAQDLYSIGNKRSAQQIWQKMIEKHKLFEEGGI